MATIHRIQSIIYVCSVHCVYNVHFITYKSGICHIAAYTFSSSENQIYCHLVYFYKVITTLQTYMWEKWKAEEKKYNETIHENGEWARQVSKQARK